MKTHSKILIGAVAAILVIVLICVASYISIYNGLVSSDESVKAALGDVQSAYQRRLDLIPNLVSTVQGSAKFEAGTLTEVTQLRAQAVSAQQSFAGSKDIAVQQQAAASAESALSRLLVIVENYPDLKSTANFADLQVQLEGTENRINVARNKYNEAVKTYNTRVRSFPANIIAGMSGFVAAKPFEADAGAAKAPVVAFP
jgi:LemA protein